EAALRVFAGRIGIDRDADGAGGAAEDRDRVGRAVGAEFPQRGAVALRRTRARQAGELTRAHVRGVVVAVDVARDQVKEVVLIEKTSAKTQAGRSACGEAK